MVGTAVASSAVHEKPPISVRLRALIVGVCGEATLTCTFRPGGRKFGQVGIRSPFYCEDCGASIMWHEVAEGLRSVVTAEEIIRAHRALSSTPSTEEGS
jgi:hypothetical protein